MVVVVVGGSVVVVVVGASLGDDVDVLVLDSADDGELVAGSGLTEVSVTDGAELTLGDGVLGALPDVCRSVIMTPAPIASTASAVPTATTSGRRYQASAVASLTSGSAASSTRARGAAAVRPPLGGWSSYSPGRIGMMPESSSASDQASAGTAGGSTGSTDMVVASLTGPSSVGASAVSPSPDPRAARSAAPTAAVS